MRPVPPKCPQKPFSVVRHGQRYEDPYQWLKDPGWQEVLKDPAKLDQEIRAYLDAENAYGKALMADTEALQETLFAELKGRLKEDDAAVPLKDGPWEYSYRYELAKQYPVYLRTPFGKSTDVKVLLDVNVLAEGREFCKVTEVTHAPDHGKLVYAVDFKGSERFELRFRDLATGRDLPDVLTETAGTAVWANDSRTVYYTKIDENHRPKWVLRHVLGTPQSADELLYEEKDDGFFIWLEKTESHAYVVLKASDHASAEFHVLPADDPKARFRLVEPRRENVMLSLTHNGEFFYLQVHEGATKDGRIVKVPVAKPDRAGWQDFVPFRQGRLIDALLMLKDHLVWLELVDALPRIVVRTLATGEEHAVAFEEAAYSLGLQGGYEFATTSIRLTYSSMTTPEQTYDYDVVKRTRVLRKQQEIPSGHDPAQYVVERLHAPARDGETVPVTLLRKKGARNDGKAPLLLTGYGSYGFSRPAGFSPHRFSLVDRGVGVAIAHIRGGKDKGYHWYESAKLMGKKKTFTDFIDCGEHLAKLGVTARGRIVAQGGSAGGMLMGAVANMAPDLWLGVIADVPFVDVLNTMYDKELPLTPPEWPEWGNPIESPEAAAYIASYSPYDNVERKAYPHLMVLAGLTDPRVTYWEPAKWVARLRERKTDQNLLIFDVNMGAGHAGASGRFDSLKKVALTWAFVLKITERK